MRGAPSSTRHVVLSCFHASVARGAHVTSPPCVCLGREPHVVVERIEVVWVSWEVAVSSCCGPRSRMRDVEYDGKVLRNGELDLSCCGFELFIVCGVRPMRRRLSHAGTDA